MAWPTSPSNGDRHTENGQLYYWSAPLSAWLFAPEAFSNKDADLNKIINLGAPSASGDIARLTDAEQYAIRVML